MREVTNTILVNFQEFQKQIRDTGPFTLPSLETFLQAEQLLDTFDGKNLPPDNIIGESEKLLLLTMGLLLKDRLNTINTIVGDDASGRIPSIFMSQLIKTVSNKRPSTIFLALNKDEQWDPASKSTHIYHTKLKEHLLKLQKLRMLKKPLLFVTDTIYSGKTINQFLQVLNDIGVNYDNIFVASIYLYVSVEREALCNNTKNYIYNVIKLDNLFVVTPTGGCYEFYGRHSKSGVIKNRRNTTPFAERHFLTRQEQKNLMLYRKNIIALAKYLGHKLKSEHKSENTQ